MHACECAHRRARVVRARVCVCAHLCAHVLREFMCVHACTTHPYGYFFFKAKIFSLIIHARAHTSTYLGEHAHTCVNTHTHTHRHTCVCVHARASASTYAHNYI